MRILNSKHGKVECKVLRIIDDYADLLSITCKVYLWIQSRTSVTGWYANEGLRASWRTGIHRLVGETPQAAEEMSSVPHVASADSPREQQYSLTRFWNPSTDNWEGANFTLLSGLSSFSCSLLPPQLMEWSHPESFPLVTPLGQRDVLAVPQHLPRSSVNIDSLSLKD